MKKLLVIVPGSQTGRDSVFYLLDSDTGECLASHFCSGYWYAKSDLYFGRPERIKSFREKYEEQELEVEFIDKTSVDQEELYRKNKEFIYPDAPPTAPSVTLTMSEEK